MDRRELEPLSKLHELGLMPLVQDLRVRQHPGTDRWKFEPRGFSRLDLNYFTAFTNVQTLRLHNVDIYRFMPGIERYFEHFSPTTRSISLSHPRCTPRQLSHFLSLFRTWTTSKFIVPTHTSPPQPLNPPTPFRSPHRNYEGGCCFLIVVGPRPGNTSSRRLVAHGFVI